MIKPDIDPSIDLDDQDQRKAAIDRVLTETKRVMFEPEGCAAIALFEQDPDNPDGTKVQVVGFGLNQEGMLTAARSFVEHTIRGMVACRCANCVREVGKLAFAYKILGGDIANLPDPRASVSVH
jgi:hypothetical protein